jgi:pimeloyl-ACP methyl ester carboxylesterase
MFTNTGDDSELHLRESGAGDAVLLLHSSGMSGEQWRRTAESLAERGYRAVVRALPSRPSVLPFDNPEVT